MAPGFTGCFEIKQGETKTADDIVKTEPKVVPRGSFTAKLDLDGTKLTVNARQTCALVEMQEVKHTTSIENRLESGTAGSLTALAILGSIPLTGGVIMLADAPKAFDSNRDARRYNPVGKGAAIALGTLLTTVGTLAVTIPIINAGRASGSEKSSSTDHREAKTIRPSVPCDGTVPPTPVGITAQAPGGPNASLGSTDSQGNLIVDLKVSLAPWFTGAAPPPVTAGIYVNGQFAGEVKVADVARAIFAERGQQDDLAWAQAEPQACGSQRSEAACARIRSYVATFPTGHHFEEAQRLVSSLAPQAPVVAQDTAAALLQRAVTSAQSAANLAANKVREKAQKDQQKALLKSEEDAAAAGKLACVATCKKVCEEPLHSQQKGVSSQSVGECKSTCAEEACP